VSLGHVEYDALFPALVAALVGDWVTRRLGVRHTEYPAAPHVDLSPLLFAKWLAFGLAVALVSTAFVELTHRLKKLGEQRVPRLPLRMAIGGALVVAMWRLSGTDDYLGLGVPTIVRAFTDPSLPWAAFALKLVFTSVTLSAGFLGGEVTPLFFIGAALGNDLARVMGLPLELAAGVGLAAVFGAASNTPIALSIMAIELLGANVAPHVFIVSVVAYLMSGHRSIYPSQRLWLRKTGDRPSRSVALREYDEGAPPSTAPSVRAPSPTQEPGTGA
jgi:H+/Cl- antiporter ClcA